MLPIVRALLAAGKLGGKFAGKGLKIAGKGIVGAGKDALLNE